MAAAIKIMGIHGLGDHRNEPWAQEWEATIRPVLRGVDLSFVPFWYDEIFQRIQISPIESVRALGKLLGSGIWSGVTGLFGRRARARGVLDEAEHWLRWYAGYVVAWVEDEEFRTTVRKRLLDAIAAEQPDLILAHSLGSLISFDAITSDDARARSAVRRQLENLTFVSLGSQIGNAFVIRNLTPGRIVMPPVRQWYHLYNSQDIVFTAGIRLPGEPDFLQVLTYFDVEGLADHGAVHYLRHPATVTSVWEPLALQRAAAPAARRAGLSRVKLQAPLSAVRTRDQRKQRALLVGINDYPSPADRLGGCVNDVFLMSSVLQECGIPVEQIRVVLDDRATAKGILDRMHWLLEDAGPYDELIFYYSGHGAQLPSYGEGDQIDRKDETLVPYDFDWSPATSVTDDQIYRLYSQLHYDTRLLMIFDCCHSGGLHRDSGVKVRGLTPPDDIRHRGLRWDSGIEMWMPRDLPPLNPEFSADDETTRKFCGSDGATLRLGRAMRLRKMSAKEYGARKKRRRGEIVGPYLPTIFQACREDQFSYEYRHGVQSYGAFTFSLAQILRSRKRLSFQDLVKATAQRLTQLDYDQTPTILGPRKIVSSIVPWQQNGTKK